jgi:integrase
MAHIRNRGKRKDGTIRWEARMLVENSWVERSFSSKREAESWLHTQQAALLGGTYVSPRQAERPFSDVLDAWRESWPQRIAPNTQARYESILKKYLIPTFGQLPIGKLTHERVQRYINGLATQTDATGNPKIAPGTVRNVYAVLRTACAKAVRLGMLMTSPCTNIDLPRPNREEMLFLTSNEVSQVPEAIDPHYRVLIYTAAYTGLRAGELAALQIRDLDLLRGVFHVRRAMKDVGGRLELGPTKTHASRTVSLPTFLRNMLEEHLAQARPHPGGTGGPELPLFTMKNGGPLRMRLVHSRYFKRAVAGWTDGWGREHPGALAGDKTHLRFHDLRHTCAALSIQAGAHPKLIAARLGHSSITVTLDRYGHLFPSMEEALADALDAAFAAGDAERVGNVARLRP